MIWHFIVRLSIALVSLIVTNVTFMLPQERQEREEELKVKEAELLRGNPLLNGATATSFSVKRRLVKILLKASSVIKL